MINNFNKILCLAPHTDDMEFGCGGTVSKFIEYEKDVYCVAFSLAKKSIPIGFSEDCTLNEFKQSTKSLGLKENNIIILDFDVREFPSYRQLILEEMIHLNQCIKPDLVILPSSFDTHQDHKTIYEEGIRAFKKTSIFGYEIITNNFFYRTDIFIPLEERHLENKINALNCYRSQEIKLPNGFDFIKNLAIIRGNQIGISYAECFECIRLII